MVRRAHKLSARESPLDRAAALHKAGRLAEAEAIYRQILSERPDDANAQHLLGLVDYARDNLDSAVERIGRAVALEPANAVFHGNLGETHRRRGEIHRAETHLRRAVALDASLGDAHNSLGVLLRRQGRLAEAATAFEAAIETNPDNPAFLMNAALAARDRGEAETATALIERALERAPERAELHNVRGNLLKDDGRMDEAAEAYRRAIALDPGFGSAYWNLVTTRRYTAADKTEVAAMDARYARDDLSAPARADLGFALGKVHDDLGKHARAFAYFEAANAVRRPPFDPRRYIDYVDRVIATYSAAFLAERAGWGEGDTRPIFIVGMIRSGTSLVEQVLASHPAVAAAGELRDIALLTERTREVGGSDAAYPESMTTTDAPAVRVLARSYLEPLARRFPAAERITDKMPPNFLHLGFVQVLLPGARVIHCRRDPLDTCLSAYFQNFTEPPPFASDLAGLGAYYRHYRRLMDHWRAVLELPMLEVDYESLVTEPEPQIRRLIDFCSLPWDDACLAPERARHPVRTASAWQVRQPVNAGSVGRWRAYARHLGPLIEALGPYAEPRDDP